MGQLFMIGGNANSMITDLENAIAYPVGTVIAKRLASHDNKRFVIVSDNFGTYGYGQRAIAEDLSMESDVHPAKEKKNGGIGIGSFDVVEDLPTYTPAQVDFLKEAYAKQRKAEGYARKAADRKKAEAHDQAVEKGRPIYEQAKPGNAVAVIMAYLQENDSDPYTDYFASHTIKSVVLAFSTHKRDLFNEMRTAAANFDETKHFCEGDPEQYEHREKWSMGRGFYLGKHRHSGWQVRKMLIDHVGERNLMALAANPDTWKVPEKGTAAQQSADVATAGDVRIVENKEKQGIEIHFASKPSPDVIARIKANGWRWAKYNKCWYKKASPAAMEFAKTFVNQ